MDKIKECINSGITCDRSWLGCFNTTLKDQGKCTECLIQLLEEHNKEVINKIIEEQSTVHDWIPCKENCLQSLRIILLQKCVKMMINLFTKQHTKFSI